MGKICTIGIGVYKRQKSWIRITLDSILNNINKYNYFDKIKICIVNDYNEQVQDFKIAKQYKQKYQDLFQLLDNKENKGIAYTYSRIITECNTPYFMAFDSDDYLTTFNIVEQCNFLDKNLEYVGSYGIRRLFDFQKNIPYNCVIGSQYLLQDFINFNCNISHNGIILRVDDAIETGNYLANYLQLSNIKIDVTCDISMFVAMLMKGDMAFRNQLRCLYNQHDKCYHKQKVNLVVSQFTNIANAVIKYCQHQNFKYDNMHLLYYSAKRFLNKKQWYIENSWLPK